MNRVKITISFIKYILSAYDAKTFSGSCVWQMSVFPILELRSFSESAYSQFLELARSMIDLPGWQVSLNVKKCYMCRTT